MTQNLFFCSFNYIQSHLQSEPQYEWPYCDAGISKSQQKMVDITVKVQIYLMPQWCENKKIKNPIMSASDDRDKHDFCVPLVSLLPQKNTSTLLFRAQQPLFLISSSISSIGLTVCSGLWTNSPFYSASLLTALMAGTAQRRVNYCIAHGWHTGARLHQLKKHECVTRRPAL